MSMYTNFDLHMFHSLDRASTVNIVLLGLLSIEVGPFLFPICNLRFKLLRVS